MNQSFPKPVDHPLSVEELRQHHPIPALAALGEGATRITHIAHPRDAAAGSIAFIARDDADALRLIADSRASVLVMKVDANPRPGQCFLKVEDPHLWYITALGLLFAPRAAPTIDASARVDPAAKIGRNCRIGAFSVVEAGCEIGDNVEIGDHVIIKHGSRIGKDCVIQHHVTIGSEGVAFHRAADDSWHFFPHHGIAWIGDDVAIGSHSVIVRGMLRNTVVGSGCKLGNYVNVAHNCEIGENCWISSKVLLCGGVKIEPDVRLASAVSISSYVKIGRGARIGLGSVVTKDVDAGTAMFGNPAKPLRTIEDILMSAAARTRLNLTFKGSRDYLTGADILMELLPLIEPARNISLRFHRLSGTSIDLVALKPADDPSNYDGVVLFDDPAGQPHRAALEAIPAAPVTERVPYPEDLAVADADISDHSIVSRKAEGFSFIERAIALNKVLLTKLCGTDTSTKWIFTRIDMPERPHMPMPSVRLTAISTSNPRLIKSALYLNETPFGHIWFAGVKQHNE